MYMQLVGTHMYMCTHKYMLHFIYMYIYITTMYIHVHSIHTYIYNYINMYNIL